MRERESDEIQQSNKQSKPEYGYLKSLLRHIYAEPHVSLASYDGT